MSNKNAKPLYCHNGEELSSMKLANELLLFFFSLKMFKIKAQCVLFFIVISKARKATDFAARPISVGVCIYTVYIYIVSHAQEYNYQFKINSRAMVQSCEHLILQGASRNGDRGY